MKKTGLPKFTEKRVIAWDFIELMIKREHWYNNGTDDELIKLKEFIGDIREVTTEDLVIIANDILEHTKFQGGNEYLCIFLTELERKCCRTFFNEKF